MPSAALTSVKSDRVTAVRRLHDRSGRRKTGLFLVEGPQAVEAAVAAGVDIHDLFVDIDAGVAVHAIAQSSGARITPATSQVLAAMGETQTSQGILATCAVPPEPSLDAVMQAPGPVVVLDQVSDPGNVGTISRTCDAVGAAGGTLTPGCADPYSGKVVRSTAGSIFHIPVLTGAVIDTVLHAARTAGRAVLALAGEGGSSLYSLPTGDLPRACWGVGSEAHGVSAAARSGASLQVAIPMEGQAESLNAGVAVSVALYVSQQRYQAAVPGAGAVG